MSSTYHPLIDPAIDSEELVVLAWRRGDPPQWQSEREWIATNGLGGYATGTIAGVCTRRYHGKLIASLPAPLGRVVMLNHLEEFIERENGSTLPLGGSEKSGAEPQIPDFLEEFRLEMGLPVWRYSKDGIVLEKKLVMPHMQNTTVIAYNLVKSPGPVKLQLRPSLHFRPHEALVSSQLGHHKVVEHRLGWEFYGGDEYPPLKMRILGDSVSSIMGEVECPHIVYRLEQDRGYESEGELWSPGEFQVTLEPGRRAYVIASTEPWDMMRALTPLEAFAAERTRRETLLRRSGVSFEDKVASQLVLAADQFIIVPNTRRADTTRAHAIGDDPRTVIAGYHWFTDWGRDTMISLPGLTLATGRFREAGSILRAFASYVRDGLIPNLFPEGEQQGLYHTADATMWFFHAVEKYVGATGDRETLRMLLPVMFDIVDHHLQGTLFGIGVDPADGLLRQGAEGYQLTWMDAKVDGWVVTPRRGKAVEINALFYNALRLLAGWARDEDFHDRAASLDEAAGRARESFNRRFWNEQRGYLYDVVDGEKGDDPSLRPNQVFAISLTHPVLDRARWGQVMEIVEKNLLTPVGLRSLGPAEPDYKSRYFGDLRARDAAYHQGTVWAWLIGPFVNAWLKVHDGDVAGARKFLEGFVPDLADGGIGTINEIFDATPPYTPRGCIAQAWSVAEVLRCWLLTGK